MMKISLANTEKIGGALMIMVILVGNVTSDHCYILDEAICVSLCLETTKN